METLENAAHLRDNGAVIAGQDWVGGRQVVGSSDYGLTTAMKQTRREKILAEIDGGLLEMVQISSMATMALYSVL